MWNVPIFKKLAQLFLKHYIGQQNMSVGCQFVTFVLKQDHCSLIVFFYLSFANALSGIVSESFIAIEFSNHVICNMSLTFGALLCLLLAGTSSLSLCLGLLLKCFPSMPPFHFCMARDNLMNPSSCLTCLLSWVSRSPGPLRGSQVHTGTHTPV